MKISKFSKSDLAFGGEDNSKSIQQSAARAKGNAEEPQIVRISFFFIQNLTMYPLSKCVGEGSGQHNEYRRYTLFFQGQVQRGGRTKFNEDFCDLGRLIKGEFCEKPDQRIEDISSCPQPPLPGSNKDCHFCFPPEGKF